ncbi:hypothetical protein DH2020_029330 [Rehmannia glutinosa]|uniref:Uncharacterized protein n=1 Tax=Rehmannia glutinosa TaxID=99300 RepID=A0ABR0VSG9_REHGL
MVGNHHFTRIDTQELKDLIYRKIGHERAERYFDQLKRYFSFKLSKADFDKSCIRTIGKENISLHNKLIRSILQNACQAKTPPQKLRKVEGLNVKVANGYQRNCLQSLYGESFPQSPRKCRSPINRDRKFRDRPSPLGPLGKSPSLTCEETVSRIQEQQSATELHSLCSRPPIVEEGEEVEQYSESLDVRRWSSITAPPGVSVNSVGARNTYNNFGDTCQSSGELPDTRSLRSHLEKKLALEGVGISMECANLLNNGLDVFLKRLIEPCIAIAGSRHTDSRILGRQSNGLLPGRFDVSMLDFRVAMESNPRLLGENWSTQLEKICHYE